MIPQIHEHDARRIAIVFISSYAMATLQDLTSSQY